MSASTRNIPQNWYIEGIAFSWRIRSMMDSDWSWLPPELFSGFFDKLSVVDRIICRGVCKSWRRAAQEKPIRRPPPESPWLMFAYPKKGCKFYSVADDKSYHMNMDPLPDIRKHMWIGSSDGWLITADERSELHLLNPVTRVQIPLPTILSLPSVTGVRDPEGNLTSYNISYRLDNFHHGPEDGYIVEFKIEETREYLFCMCKAAVSWSDENSWTVVLLFMPGPRLAYARSGDDAWTLLDHGLWADLILHDGHLCALYPRDKGGTVGIWHLTAARPSPVIRTEILNKKVVLHSSYPYLAVSSSSTGKKQLLLVEREYYLEDEYHTTGFKVYRLRNNRRKPRWVRMRSLGDQALFIGSNSCRCLSTQVFPKLKRNCIYFADDYWEQAMYAREETRDIGVYNLEDGTIAPCHPEDMSTLHWPPPVWITPSLR